MRFLFDENADRPLANYLGSVGQDVTAVGRNYPHSISDIDILAIAWREPRIVVTNDHDFGEPVFFPQLPHAGVILFRLEDETLAVKIGWLDYVPTRHVADLDHFIVISDHGVRVRRSPQQRRGDGEGANGGTANAD